MTFTPIKNDENKIKDEGKVTNNIFEPVKEVKIKRLTLPEETQKSIQELLPPNTLEEILSCESNEAMAADKLILYFGKNIGKCKDQIELISMMQILQIALKFQALEGCFTKEKIYQIFSQKYRELTWEEFEGIFKLMVGQSQYDPIQKKVDKYILTKLGNFLILTYEKLKSETLILQKAGPLSDLYAMIENIRDFWDYDQYGQGVEWVYPLLTNLTSLIESIRNEGEAILKDPEVDSKIKGVLSLITEIQDFQKNGNVNTMDIKINQSVYIANSLVQAIKELYVITRKKFEIRKSSVFNVLNQSPFPDMEKHIINHLDDIDWQGIFEQCSTCAYPTQVSMKINEYIVKKALESFITKKDEIEYTQLPPSPPEEILDKSIDDLLIRNDELLSLKEMIFSQARNMAPTTEYEVVKECDLTKFHMRLQLIYGLAIDQKLHFDTESQSKQDKINHIESFTAHNFILKNHETMIIESLNNKKDE